MQGFQTDFDFTAASPFKILGNFIVLALASLSIGLAAGLFSSLLFKWCRILTHSAITETILLLIIAMTAYFLSEFAELSGIISLLTCGISMAHYTWYNLSPQGKTISSVTFAIFGSFAEAVVFAYIGLCSFTYVTNDYKDGEYQWSISFIMWMTAIIIVGRTMAVFSAHFIVKMCQKNTDVSVRELIFISYGGMIRGAIAFGLVLKIPEGAEGGNVAFKERGVVVTTTLAVVILTTVVFGTFMPVVQKLLVPTGSAKPEEETKPSN